MMSKYKMIAIDLDGTLLTNDKRISRANADAIREAMANGIRVCLCTGRAWPGCKEFARELHPNCLVITSNGAMIVDPHFDNERDEGNTSDEKDEAEIVYNETLRPEDAMKIYALGNKWNISQIVWYNNILHGNRIDEKLIDYGKRYGKMDPVLCTDFEEKAAKGISKILWYSTPENVRKWCEKGADKISEGVTCCTSDPWFLEFYSKKVSKATAIRFVADKYGITLNETAAVGDGSNDLPILKAVGLGVAMGNASDEIKKLCGHVTLSNEEDGVAALIHDILRSHGKEEK